AAALAPISRTGVVPFIRAHPLPLSTEVRGPCWRARDTTSSGGFGATKPSFLIEWLRAGERPAGPAQDRPYGKQTGQSRTLRQVWLKPDATRERSEQQTHGAAQAQSAHDDLGVSRVEVRGAARVAAHGCHAEMRREPPSGFEADVVTDSRLVIPADRCA